MVASSWLRNSGVNNFLIASSSSPSRLPRPKPIASLAASGSARTAVEDQDHIAEIDLLAVMVGELAVIHHLQQDVEEIAMGFLDFVQQQHAMGVLVHAVGEKTAPMKSDIAGRRSADQLARRPWRFHIFARHVEAQKFDAQ